MEIAFSLVVLKDLSDFQDPKKFAMQISGVPKSERFSSIPEKGHLFPSISKKIVI